MKKPLILLASLVAILFGLLITLILVKVEVRAEPSVSTEIQAATQPEPTSKHQPQPEPEPKPQLKLAPKPKEGAKVMALRGLGKSSMQEKYPVEFSWGFPGVNRTSK